MTNKTIGLIAILLLSTTCAQEDFLEGYDTTSLFAEPTPAELDRVMSDWSGRDLSPQQYKVEQISNVGSDGAVLKIVSFAVNGLKEYGALLIPKSDQPLPVHMYIGGFSLDNTVNAINLVQSSGTTGTAFIFAFPALRGQSLSITINNIEYPSPTSQGFHCDAFDGATDDAIAFLNVIQTTEDQAAMDRVAIRGGSRGGTVALLTAIRDKRIKLAIDVAGPVNLLSQTLSHQNDNTYQCQFLRDLVYNNLPPAEARHRMIASSPVYFSDQLPKTQLHLAADDRIVPVEQGTQLKDAMNGNNVELFIYPNRDHTNIGNNNTELTERINQFLSTL